MGAKGDYFARCQCRSNHLVNSLSGQQLSGGRQAFK